MINKEHKRWLAENGEQKRLDYPLNRDSVYVDIGAYDGSFAKKVYDKYKCRVVAFEPVPRIFKQAYQTLEYASPVIYNCAVGKFDGFVTIKDEGNASQVGSDGIEVEQVDVVKCLGYDGEVIDLMKINIEGGEYDVLERMIETGMIKRVKYLLVQFHNFDHLDSPVERRDRIRGLLGTTHKCQWSYDFVWESWERA